MLWKSIYDKFSAISGIWNYSIKNLCIYSFRFWLHYFLMLNVFSKDMSSLFIHAEVDGSVRTYYSGAENKFKGQGYIAVS